MGIGQWLDRRLFGSGAPDSYGAEASGARSRIGAQGAGASADYLQRARGFDPMSSIREAASGLFDQFEQTAGRRIRNQRGTQVGAGRLGSGYGALDESEALYDARSDLNSKIAGLATEGANLTLRNNEDIGQFGQGQEGQYLDLLSGERDRETSKYNDNSRRRGAFWGGLGKLAGQAFGAATGAGGG